LLCNSISREDTLVRRKSRFQLLFSVTLLLVVCAVVPGSASASKVAIPAYGEVERFGGFESGASYGASATTDLKGSVGGPARFVYPIGMVVDGEDPSTAGKYAIYVLDNVNPQALNERLTEGRTASMSLEYRIQKLDEKGNVLASSSFTLTSTAGEENLHAVSLALDGAADRVYVLIEDAPSAGVGNEINDNAAVRVDAWTTGRHGAALSPAVGLKEGADDELPEDPLTKAGELAGPDTTRPELLQSKTSFDGDIQGESIAVDGAGANADLAIAGNRYTSAATTVPVIERIKTEGAAAGELDGSQWSDASGTEDAAAQATGQTSSKLYAASPNPDGSLNVMLGPEAQSSSADGEPNMATVGSDLTSTQGVLPWSDVTEDLLTHTTVSPINLDRSATTGFVQDIEATGGNFMPYGGTPLAGTLAPSVVQLGEGTQFPAGLYAGVVAENSGEDSQNPAPGSMYSWTYAFGQKANGIYSLGSPASIGIRVFSANSTAKEEASLAMIGNVVAGGPCNLQSSPTVFKGGYRGGSFVALAQGRAGTVFALVQPNLTNTSELLAKTELIAPGSSVGASMGDQIVEFAPGAGQNGAPGLECPQPSGGFSVTNVTQNEPPSAGSSEVAVPVGTTLKFDASEVDLHGSSPWAYDWNLEGGVNKGNGPSFNNEWTLENTFTSEPGLGTAWKWPESTVEAEYKTAGSYTETLNLVNDFGTLAASRAVRVVASGAISGTLAIAPGATAEQSVLLKASAELPQGDKVKDYHWDFGDGQGEDTGETAQVQHAWSEAKTYTVTLTITDALGQKAEVKESVTVAPATEEKHEVQKEVAKQETPPAGKQEAPPVKQEAPPVGKAPAVAPKSKPLTNAQKLAEALKVCKKIKAKRQRVSCEKQARKKYAPKAKAKKKASKKK
jgi:hypothetical protein